MGAGAALGTGAALGVLALGGAERPGSFETTEVCAILLSDLEAVADLLIFVPLDFSVTLEIKDEIFLAFFADRNPVRRFPG